MNRFSVRRSVGAAALLVTAVAVVACGPASASAPSTPTLPVATSAPATSNAATTTPPPAPPTTAPPNAATAHPVDAAKPTPTIYASCDETAVAHPSEVTLTCADAGMVLENLHWKNWGEATAYATGTLDSNDCTPNCAEGTFDHFTATATVSNLTQGHYTKIYVEAPGAPQAPYWFDLKPETN